MTAAPTAWDAAGVGGSQIVAVQYVRTVDAASLYGIVRLARVRR